MKKLSYQTTGKRMFDVAASAVLLAGLGPVMAVTAVAIRLKLGSPVLFRQVRPGLHGRPFTLIKFRTMLDATDSDGVLLPDSQRLTSFGSLLRSTSLDELPEIVNVIRGDMSIVGPRPLLMKYLPLYTENQRRRHEVRPGITGLAQTRGRNQLGWPERFDLDVEYIDSLSFRSDLSILIETSRTVLHRTGITDGKSATATEFTGDPH